jgi:hypothetical protein
MKKRKKPAIPWFAFSDILGIPKQVLAGETVNLKVPLYHKDDYGKREGFSCFMTMKTPRTAHLHIKMKEWIPFNRHGINMLQCATCKMVDDSGVAGKVKKAYYIRPSNTKRVTIGYEVSRQSRKGRAEKYQL